MMKRDKVAGKASIKPPNNVYEKLVNQGSRKSSSHAHYKLALAFALSCLVWIGWTADFFELWSPTSYEEASRNEHSQKMIGSRVDHILQNSPLIVDGHNDLAYYLRWAHNNHLNRHKFIDGFEEGTLGGEVDLGRLLKGKSGGTFWSTFSDCPEEGYSLEYHAKALATTEAAIDVLHRIHATYPHVFVQPHNSSDALEIFRSGRIISPLAVEGLHLLGDSFAKLRAYHARGIRLITLTHNCHNSYADAALVKTPGFGLGPSQPKWGGISPAGKAFVQEMNRLGIIVDLSHTSTDTMRAVLGAGNRGTHSSEPWKGTLAPPVFSHSNAFGLCPHPRNIPDDVLWLLKEQHGVAMVTFSPDFVSYHWPDGHAVDDKLPTRVDANLTMHQVVRHMRYIGDMIGYDHVGIGSDFDGVTSVIKGLEDVSKYPALIEEMLTQGISDEVVKKIVGGNILRVWNEVDQVASRMQNERVLPAEDILPDLDDPWEKPF